MLYDRRVMDQFNTSPLSDASPYNHDVSEANIVAAMAELIDLLSSERVSSNREECIAHSSTPWSPAEVAQRPALIVYPGDTVQVSQIMKICSRRRIPVIGYSGGTSFHGALTATRGGICVDFKFMDKILAVHADDLDVVVQPAVEWQELNSKLSSHGLFFPPDPGPGARIGGMVSPHC
jgi:D-lactate dehydrogenase (cytochrome)